MIRRISSIALVAWTIGAVAQAQAVLYDYPAFQDEGDVVAGLGDVDGDGIPDFAVGAPDAGATDIGEVRVYRGSDGTLLYTIQCVDQPSDRFGRFVRALHDLDGDGIRDLYVLAIDVSMSPPYTGYVHSGRDGHLLLGPFGGGIVIEPCGDIDGDGIDDWIQSFESGVHYRSHVQVRSGRDASALFTIPGAGQWAPQVAGLDDVNHDGHADFLVADFDATNSNGDAFAGVVQVRSGANKHVLLQIEGAKKDSELGVVAGRTADHDGDGLADFVVMDRTDVGNGALPRLLLLSSATGQTLLTMTHDLAGSLMGERVVDAGDMNGDGVSDIAIGCEPISSPHVLPRIFSGSTGQPLYTFFSEYDDVVAGDIDAAGDVDGDGRADLLLGAWVYLPDSSIEIFARVVSGNDLWLDAGQRQAYPGSPFSLTTREGVPGNLSVTVLLEVGGTPMFRVVDGVATFDATGSRVLTGTVPYGVKGLDVKLESYACDASGRLIESAPEVIIFD